jgi:hypothetical protein
MKKWLNDRINVLKTPVGLGICGVSLLFGILVGNLFLILSTN